MSKIQVRVNGRGNAWPVVLGQEHPFYDRNKLQDLANASFSIVKTKVGKTELERIQWDLMIDAGHGAVQYLLKNCNRIPEAVFLTHPHIDHTLGLDWIVQSYFKTYNRPYPVYATILCWEFVKSTFPQLESMVDFKELIPFEEKELEEVKGVHVTAFPVYHGKSAIGASMLLFEIKQDNEKGKVLFTGDILCPLLRKNDYSILEGVDLVVADANNRYPYPRSNHWSILERFKNKESQYLKKFKDKCTIGLLLEPHLKEFSTDNYSRQFDYFLNKRVKIEDFHFTLESFIKRIQAQKVALIHYSGAEDKKYYNKEIFTDQELNIFVNKHFNTMVSTEFNVPYVSQHIDFLKL